MITIKPHSHLDRAKIVENLIPQIKVIFNDNLVAFAADGSFARGDDQSYSDLELIVFVKEPSKDASLRNLRKIIDGLLVVIVADTKESFIEKYLDISEVWYVSGAGKLLPVINNEFINELNDYRAVDVEKKCLAQATKKWPHYQEATAKVLNAIESKNREAIPLAFFTMMNELFAVLAFLNCTPYLTLSSYLEQTRKFSFKPEGFDQLLNVLVCGEYQQLERLRELVLQIFNDLETNLIKKGCSLSENSVGNFFEETIAA